MPTVVIHRDVLDGGGSLIELIMKTQTTFLELEFFFQIQKSAWNDA